jgi:2-oxoglutarate ferredoxin oxidoreductase subunit alpha
MMERVNLHLQEKYAQIRANEIRYEGVMLEDAEVVIVAYGLAARISHRAVEMARQKGIKAGLLRPITLYPFPAPQLRALGKRVRDILVVEMNAGQMVEDVRLAVEGSVPVSFHGRMGGLIPASEEVLEHLLQLERSGGTKTATAETPREDLLETSAVERG